MWKEYQSKPITRRAHKIAIDDVIAQDEEHENVFYLISEQIENGTPVKFCTIDDVAAGDFVLKIDEEDIYHCKASVFEDRNVVDEEGGFKR